MRIWSIDTGPNNSILCIISKKHDRSFCLTNYNRIGRTLQRPKYSSPTVCSNLCLSFKLRTFTAAHIILQIIWKRKLHFLLWVNLMTLHFYIISIRMASPSFITIFAIFSFLRPTWGVYANSKKWIVDMFAHFAHQTFPVSLFPQIMFYRLMGYKVLFILIYTACCFQIHIWRI